MVAHFGEKMKKVTGSSSLFAAKAEEAVKTIVFYTMVAIIYFVLAQAPAYRWHDTVIVGAMPFAWLAALIPGVIWMGLFAASGFSRHTAAWITLVAAGLGTLITQGVVLAEYYDVLLANDYLLAWIIMPTILWVAVASRIFWMWRKIINNPEPFGFRALARSFWDFLDEPVPKDTGSSEKDR